MKKIFLFALLALPALHSISQQYVIKANITGFPDGTKFMLRDMAAEADIDSVLIQHNTFILKGRLASTPQNLWIYSIYNKKDYYIVLLIGNDNISIQGDIKDFPFDLSVRGSSIQDDENLLLNLSKEGYKERNRLVMEYFALKGDSAEIKGKAIWKKISVIDSTNGVITKTFVLEHPKTYASLDAIYDLRAVFGRDSLQKMYASLPPAMQQSQFGQRIFNYLKVGNPVKPGDSMADFQAFDREGKTRHPAEYKGKYILLDFSSTYCGPCVASVPEMKKLAVHYADKLSIVSLSGDIDKKTWLTGMERDKPTWLSLWDGKGIYSETMMKYAISGFPTFCLIDPDGKIVSQWVGYEEGTGSLETAIKKGISN